MAMTAEDDIALLATNFVVDSYEAALGQGVPVQTVATAALSSALGLMVQLHGEDIVARMIEDLPAKIRRGDFTHKRK